MDDAEEIVCARKADTRNLQKGCRLRITRAQAMKEIDRNRASLRDIRYGRISIRSRT